LPLGKTSGLVEALKVVAGIEEIALAQQEAVEAVRA